MTATQATKVFSMRATIEPDELSRLLETNDVILLDASYGSSLMAGVTPYQFWQYARIKDAIYFDIDDVADPNAELPHTIPPKQIFEEKMGLLGIKNEHHIVIYDQTGIAMAAARAWWMFRYFGHENVQVLNGGLPAWMGAKLEVVNKPPSIPLITSSYKAHTNIELLTMRDEILDLVTDNQNLHAQNDATIVDARAADRFHGKAPEPRPGMKSGHIPESVNLPYTKLMDNASGKIRSNAELEVILAPYSTTNKIISTCGSGVTACVLALAFFNLGRTNVSVYDGSWSEWGNAADDMPIV
jgi:thiosulfate/3-mercaptopyruvate sulfurtransferase